MHKSIFMVCDRENHWHFNLSCVGLICVSDGSPNVGLLIGEPYTFHKDWPTVTITPISSGSLVVFHLTSPRTLISLETFLNCQKGGH